MTTAEAPTRDEPLDAVEETAALWVARRHRGDWAEGDQRELDAWLAASTGHRVAWLRLKRAWECSAPMAALAPPTPTPTPAPAPSPSPSPPIQLVPPSRPSMPPEPLWRGGLWRIAAGVLLMVGAGTLSYQHFFADSVARYDTAVGVNRDVPLADGSHLLLNTDTRVRARVDANARTVWLDRGEAFFDVAHDAAHPFVVEAGDRRITVLGTRFSVRREADSTTVVVLEGRVQVADARGASPAALVLPNGTYVAAAGHVATSTRSPAQTADALAWRQGKVVFDQTTLGEAAAQFNRYNDRKLVLADAGTARIRIGGRFDVGNMAAFVRLLHQGFGVGVRESGQQIILSSPPGGN